PPSKKFVFVSEIAKEC
ncbi:hypothetical protein D030_1632B, partial [Vibrio parahaemolyticus AQ3810]